MKRTVFFGAILVTVSFVLLQGVAQVTAAVKTYQISKLFESVYSRSERRHVCIAHLAQ